MANKNQTKTEEREQFLKQVGETNSKKLRSKATRWELLIVKALKRLNYEFRFQYPIVLRSKYLYILDFYFPKFNVALEINSKQWHTLPTHVKKDKIRKRRLRKEGIEILVLWNTQIETMKDETLLQIMKIAELMYEERQKDLLKNPKNDN